MLRRLFIRCTGVLTFLCMVSPIWATPPVFTPEQTQAIQQILHEYLVAHPKILITLFDLLKKQEDTANLASIQSHRASIFHDPQTPILGNARGDITLVAFLDYRCHHCKLMNQVIETLMASDPKLRIVIKLLPILGDDSLYAARTALASMQQGHFPAFHHAAFHATPPLNPKTVDQLAHQLSIDTKPVTTDATLMDQIHNNIRLAQSIGITGTPAIILSDSAHQKPPVYRVGSVDLPTLKALIKALRHG